MSMRLDQPQPTLTARRTALDAASVRAFWARVLREFAVQDWLVIGYNLVLVLAAYQAVGPARDLSLGRMTSSLAIVILTVVMVRSSLLRDSIVAPLLYRLAVYGSVQLSYFALRDLLPIATSRRLDEHLYRLDVAIFGVEPTLFADRFVTPHTTEWFSFFYFSYFAVLAVHVLPMLFITRRARLFSEFALGGLLVFCTAHVLYMVVPGYGPFRHLAPLYHHALPGGFWHDLVMEAVASGGAQIDIFPSLHTAGPTYIALFSFRHRDKLPFKYTWPVAAFFAMNIIGATIFLRWHYLIDVMAGLTLAASALALSVRLRAWEDRRRAGFAFTPVWPLSWGRAAIDDPEVPAAPSARPATSAVA